MEAVFQISKQVYEIWIRNDSNNNDLMWFHFRMRNHNNFSEKIKIKFVNLSTDKNLLQCVRSEIDNTTNFIGNETFILVQKFKRSI